MNFDVIGTIALIAVSTVIGWLFADSSKATKTWKDGYVSGYEEALDIAQRLTDLENEA